MGIKHAFVSLVTDVGGPTYVQPTHWNAPLNAPDFQLIDFTGLLPTAVSSMACPSTAGATGFEFFDNNADGRGRKALNTTFVDSLQMYVGMASIQSGPIDTGSAALRLQYMASGFPGSWYSFDATGGSAPFVSLATAHNASLFLASHGLRRSASVVVSAAAKALPQPLTVRVAEYGGGGSAAGLTTLFVNGS
jgi:hypothetical protein